MKHAWIVGQRKAFVVLDVSVSGYRAWKGGGKPERKQLTDAQMLILIQSIHAEFVGDLRHSAYGQGIACRADSRQSNKITLPHSGFYPARYQLRACARLIGIGTGC